MVAVMIMLAVIAIVVVYVIGIHNRLVTLKNRFLNAFAQIDVQLKRRYDLIPNLIETAKSYMAHERETLEAVIAARNQAMAGLKAVNADLSSTAAIGELAGAEASLAGAMSKFSMVMEAYPELKANERPLHEVITRTGILSLFSF